MSNRKYSRRKRIVIAYMLRAAVLSLLAGMVTLMICGGIYIFQWVFGGEESRTLSATQNHNTSEVEIIGNETVPDKGSEEKEDTETPDDKPEEMFSVVLDAGHGGNDGGTYSGKIIEKDITLSVVEQMRELLEAEGVNVILTRETDEYVSLEDRAYTANKSQADLFVSIHCNYYEDDTSVSGLECYYCEGSDSGREYAENITDDLKECKEIKVREAKEADFFVLKQTDIPAVLIEIGFLSNPTECKKLSSEEYQKVLAEEMVNGILDAANI